MSELMWTYVKAAVPVPFKQYIRRRVVEPALRAHHRRELRTLVGQLRKHPEIDRTFLETLRRIWGNEAFSADVTYLQELGHRVTRCNGTILECGSGLTTILAGVLAERSGATIWSLEQDEGWARQVGQALAANGLERVRLLYRPLRRYGHFVWYDVGPRDLPRDLSLILCDGPAVFKEWGEPLYQGWRYGVLPVLSSHLIAFGDVLLDDADEPRAPSVLKRWCTEFALHQRTIRSADGECAVLASSAH
jgi:hypothetical protein